MKMGQHRVSKLGWLLLLAGTWACSGDASSSPSACSGKGGDADRDDVCQASDNCPEDANSDQRDTDDDGIGDLCDETPGECDSHGGDSDDDTVCDAFDNCPDDVNRDQRDRDLNGKGDACDSDAEPSGAAGAGPDCGGIGGDQDGDDWCGLNDNCLDVRNPDQADADKDGIGDACDEETCDGLDNNGDGTVDEGFPDGDDDGVADCRDKCPKAEDVDEDGDLIIDCLDKCPDDIVNDPDNDGICAGVDNCPAVSNATQVDGDHDGVGDSCELEICDGIDNDGDNSVDESTGAGDEDGDGVCDEIDACPDDSNNDIDGDGLCVVDDNCAGIANPTQQDSDDDGWGDACDLDSGGSCGASAELGSNPIPANLVLGTMAVDKTRALVLGTVRSTAATMANHLVVIDPATQTIAWSLAVGSDPGRIAIASDGTRAYVSLEGADSVRVVDLVERRACFQFTIASRWLRDGVTIGDLAILPGNAETLVVSARSGSSSSGVLQVVDNGAPRPVEYHGYSGSSPAFIETIDENRLWMMNEYYPYGPIEVQVDDDGIRAAGQRPLGNLRLSNTDMVYADDVLFMTNGQVVDPFVPKLLGTFPAQGALSIDPDRNEAYFPGGFSSTPEVRVYDTREFTLLRTMAVPMPTPGYASVTQILRWGASGLVLNTSTGLKFMSVE